MGKDFCPNYLHPFLDCCYLGLTGDMQMEEGGLRDWGDDSIGVLCEESGIDFCPKDRPSPKQVALTLVRLAGVPS